MHSHGYMWDLRGQFHHGTKFCWTVLGYTDSDLFLGDTKETEINGILFVYSPNKPWFYTVPVDM